MDNSTIKILLVDDEPNILLALDFLFRREGYQIKTATNGLQALEIAEHFRPDLIILDVMMPGLDGFETAKRLRQEETHNDMKIIFLTAKGAQSDRQTGYAIGGEYYIVKPFDNDDLLQTVRELLEFG